MLSGLLNLHRDAEHGDGDKQEHAEECVDVFHCSTQLLGLIVALRFGVSDRAY